MRYVCVAAALMLLPADSGAQSALGTQAGVEARDATVNPQLRVYVGMWTIHFRDLGGGFQQNWTLGVAWRGMIAGTFINSYGDRAYLAGLQGTMARGSDGTVVPRLGYRVGLLTGYDDRFLPIASKVPALPMVQLLGGLDSRGAGVELAWAGLVSSLGPSLAF